MRKRLNIELWDRLEAEATAEAEAKAEEARAARADTTTRSYLVDLTPEQLEGLSNLFAQRAARSFVGNDAPPEEPEDGSEAWLEALDNRDDMDGQAGEEDGEQAQEPANEPADNNGHAARLPVGESGGGGGGDGNGLAAQLALRRMELERTRTPAVAIGSIKYEDEACDNTGCFLDVEKVVKGIRWMVEPWVPFGMLTGIIAQPKTAKSLFAMYALAGPVITAGSWWTGQLGPREPGYVVWCDTERRAAINLARARQWGLPMDRILTPFGGNDILKPVNLEDDSHISRIVSVVCRYKAPLVIVDSLRGGHAMNENDSCMVKPLKGLARIAEETSANVSVIHHTGKMGEGAEMTLNSARGTNAFLAAVAAQIAIDIPNPYPESGESPWRRVQLLGENLGAAPLPFGFQITNEGLVYGPAPERPEKKTEQDNIEVWLRQKMEPGQTYKSGDIIEEAVQHGLHKRTVQRVATEKLGIAPQPVREGNKIAYWTWTLP
jgi:hypothetical protein